MSPSPGRNQGATGQAAQCPARPRAGLRTSLTDTGRGPLPDRGAGCTSFDPHSRSLPSRGSPADGAPDRVGEVASALVGVVRLPGDARRGLGAGAAPVTANRGVRSGARGRPRCIRPAMHPVPGCVGSAELLLAPRSPYARDAPPFTPCRAGAGALQPAGGLVGLGVRRRKAPLLGQPIRQVVRAVPRRQTNRRLRLRLRPTNPPGVRAVPTAQTPGPLRSRGHLRRRAPSRGCPCVRGGSVTGHAKWPRGERRRLS